MTDKIVVFCTCDSEEAAQKVSRHVLEKRLAACVNIVPGIKSLYWWQDSIEQSGECLLCIKSSRPLFDRLRQEIEAVHPYQVPEVLALTVVDGAPGYLQWLSQELKQPAD